MFSYYARSRAYNFIHYTCYRAQNFVSLCSFPGYNVVSLCLFQGPPEEESKELVQLMVEMQKLSDKSGGIPHVSVIG